MIDRSTEIAGRQVPIEPGEPSTIIFSGGRNGESDRGVWEFWTAAADGPNGAVTRCHVDSDPGERFRQMETGPKAERDLHVAVVSKAKLVRPASAKDVVNWLEVEVHREDALCAGSGRISAKAVRVIRTSDSWTIEPD